MVRTAFGLGLMALAGLLLAGAPSPVAAQGKDHTIRQFAVQRPPQVTIHPRRRHLSPNATRHCVSWLAKEIWPNGQPVITPQMRCWWED